MTIRINPGAKHLLDTVAGNCPRLSTDKIVGLMLDTAIRGTGNPLTESECQKLRDLTATSREEHLTWKAYNANRGVANTAIEITLSVDSDRIAVVRNRQTALRKCRWQVNIEYIVARAIENFIYELRLEASRTERDFLYAFLDWLSLKQKLE